MKAGEYTHRTKMYTNIIKSSKVKTKDGDETTLDERSSELLAMDIINILEVDKYKKCEIMDKIRETTEFKQYIKSNCGDFYFNYYSKLEINQFTFRFVYLCTYLDYEGYLVYGNSKNENRLMTKKDLFEVLNLSSKECYRTLDYLLDNKLITFEDDKYIKVNHNISVKGEITYKKRVVRVFEDTIKVIYENSLPKEHKKLALLFKILPMIHYDLNVVCHNPDTMHDEIINPYSLTELAQDLGYSTTQKLRKGLMDLKVNGELVIMMAKINNKDMIVVNPKIYYKGNKIEDMKGIIRLFGIK